MKRDIARQASELHPLIRDPKCAWFSIAASIRYPLCLNYLTEAALSPVQRLCTLAKTCDKARREERNQLLTGDADVRGVDRDLSIVAVPGLASLDRGVDPEVHVLTAGAEYHRAARQGVRQREVVVEAGGELRAAGGATLAGPEILGSHPGAGAVFVGHEDESAVVDFEDSQADAIGHADGQGEVAALAVAGIATLSGGAVLVEEDAERLAVGRRDHLHSAAWAAAATEGDLALVDGEGGRLQELARVREGRREQQQEREGCEEGVAGAGHGEVLTTERSSAWVTRCTGMYQR
mmetsp:Transcript_20125/g.51544  ORF Transcript_20125/g.51544 Transcript_20125/m.51544 type:complete len:293 (-) Transcript_20125:96-974(-)